MDNEPRRYKIDRPSWRTRLRWALGRESLKDSYESQEKERVVMQTAYLPPIYEQPAFKVDIIPPQSGSLSEDQLLPEDGDITIFQYSDLVRQGVTKYYVVRGVGTETGVDYAWHKTSVFPDGSMKSQSADLNDIIPRDVPDSLQQVSLQGRLTGIGSDKLDRIIMLRQTVQSEQDFASLGVSRDISLAKTLAMIVQPQE